MSTKNNELTLNRKDVQHSAWLYVFFHHSAQNYERMMGLAFAHALAKPLRKLYTDDNDYKAALKRHMQYFNSEPTLGAIIPGIVLALEEGKAKGKDVSDELIISTKTAMMGPLAGIGDSLIGSVYQTIIASIAISLSIESGSFLGPIFYLIFSAAAMVGLKYLLFMKGYDLSLNSLKLLSSDITKMLTTVLNIVGLITVGGITANTVKINVQWQYTSGELVVSIQEILDKIMPGVLPLLLTIGVWYLYSKKNWSTTKALFLVIACSFVLVLLGIL